MSNLDELFEGRHFGREIIVLCVRWIYGTSSASGISWIWWSNPGCPWRTPRSCPGSSALHAGIRKRWNRFARPASRSWRVDETYVKTKGRWTDLYRAVDKEGKTIDFLLRAKREVAAAKAFFRRPFRRQGKLLNKLRARVWNTYDDIVEACKRPGTSSPPIPRASDQSLP
jgi:hypothetical protein